jgi:predicted nucleic acid-binding protein
LTRVHLDTDFLVFALAAAGKERRRLLELAGSDADLQISAVAWYEFSRGPRTPEQLAVARSLFFADGIVPFSEELAALAAEVFRGLGSPRARAADIAIGVTAAAFDAVLLTRNARDFAGIPRLEVESTAAR